MQGKITNIFDSVIHYSFYFLLFLVPFLFAPFNSELFEFNKMLATYALAVIIAGAWAIKCILSGKIIFRRTVLDIPLLLFLVSQIASTYFSIDPHTSIWGYYSRSHGGLLSTITYLVLYWAFVSNMGVEEIKTAIKYLLSGALIISVWGILEHFGTSPSCVLLKGELNADCWVQDVQTRVFATLGQPNWLAAWLVAIAPLTWAIANVKLKTQNEKLQLRTKNFWLWTGMSCIIFATILFTKSRSGLLGFGSAFIFFWSVITWVHKFDLKSLLRPFLLLVTSYLLLFIVFGTPWTPSVSSWLTNQKAESVKTETVTQLETGGTESGEIRKIVWRGALDILRAYPFFGSGVETFAYSYYQFRPIEHNMTSEWDFLYNKAHNEYLNFAATTGVFGLISYLALIAVVLFILVRKIYIVNYTNQSQKTQIIREHSRNIGKIRDINGHIPVAILAGFVSILVTNFFGFSVVNVATLFFLFPAMAMVMMQNKSDSLTRNIVTISNESQVIKLRVTLILPILLTTFYILLRLAQIWQADTLYAKAEKFKIDTPYPSIRYAEEALDLRPGEPLYYDKLAQSLSYFAIEAEEENQHEAALSSAQISDEASLYATTLSPYNLSLLKSRAVILHRLATIDPKYLNNSLPVLEKAVSLAPTDPKVHYNLGVLYSRLGQNEQARKIFEKTVILKPDYEDAQNALKIIQEKF